MKITLFLVLAGLITLFPQTVKADDSKEVYSINVNKLCAVVVEIPYGSDNFSDEKWNEFKDCRNFIRFFTQND